MHQLPVVGRVSQILLPTNTTRIGAGGGWTRSTGTRPKYQWKHRYPEVLRWFREAGFSDLYVADEPICVRGLKVGGR